MKITVIGELCQDIFVYGKTDRLSPEAPVPVFVPTDTITNPGMAGNVVENLLSIEANCEINFIHQQEQIKKTRYVDSKSNHMFIRIDEGEKSISPISLTDEHISMIKDSDAVIISDYNKGFLNEEAIFEISKNAKFIVMDTKKIISEELIWNFNFIKLNEHEYSNFNSDIKRRYPDKLIVTLGSKGAKYLDEIFASPDPKETIDVSGAGDTFTSAFTINYLKTESITESIIFANQMAAIVVSKRGVATPN